MWRNSSSHSPVIGRRYVDRVGHSANTLIEGAVAEYVERPGWRVPSQKTGPCREILDFLPSLSCRDVNYNCGASSCAVHWWTSEPRNESRNGPWLVTRLVLQYEPRNERLVGPPVYSWTLFGIMTRVEPCVDQRPSASLRASIDDAVCADVFPPAHQCGRWRGHWHNKIP